MKRSVDKADLQETLGLKSSQEEVKGIDKTEHRAMFSSLLPYSLSVPLSVLFPPMFCLISKCYYVDVASLFLGSITRHLFKICSLWGKQMTHFSNLIFLIWFTVSYFILSVSNPFDHLCCLYHFEICYSSFF